MKAQILEHLNTPLVLKEIPKPKIENHQMLIQVSVCGVCRTDLHIVDGELNHPNLPLILGHQVVGTVVETGPLITKFHIGDRVGVPWLGSTCHDCTYCLKNEENLCNEAKFTGYDLQGGYAEFCVANENTCYLLPKNIDDIHVAPLLCAGLIGYRAYSKIWNAKRIGFYGFGSSAHILTQLAVHNKKEIYAFTRPGDNETQTFAKQLGAVWAGSSTDKPPFVLDAAIIFAPIGSLMITALENVRKGGIVISAGIHMSPIPSFSYDLLWGERVLTSVANLTHQDGIEFFKTIEQIPLKIEVAVFPLEEANQALNYLRKGLNKGSIVLKVTKDFFVEP